MEVRWSVFLAMYAAAAAQMVLAHRGATTTTTTTTTHNHEKTKQQKQWDIHGVCLIDSMILPQVHLRKPCYDFSFL